MTNTPEGQSYSRYLSAFKVYFVLMVACVALLLLALFAQSYIYHRRAEVAGKLVNHTQQVLHAVRKTNLRFVEMLEAERAYGATGNAAYLATYERSYKDARASIGKLQELTAGNVIQQQRLQRLDTLLRLKNAAVAEAIKKQRPRPNLQADDAFLLNRQVRTALLGFSATEDTLLQRRSNVLYQTRQSRLNTSNALYGIFTVIMGLLLWNIVRLFRRQVRGERKLQQSEGRYRNFIEGSGIAMASLSHDGVVRFCNSHVPVLTGFTEAQFTGKPLSRLIASRFLPQIDAAMKASQGKMQSLELQLHTADGPDRWVSCRIFPTHADGKGPNDWQVLFWDIEDEKQLQQEVQQLEAQQLEEQHTLQDIIDNLPMLIVLKDVHGRYYVVNKKTCEQTKLTASQMIGHTDKELFSDLKGIDTYIEADQHVIKYKTATTLENEIELGGKRMFMWITKFPLLDKDGQVKYVCTLSTNVSNFKEVEEKLRVAKEAADKSKAVQEAFIANISHEIRTPMNGIIGMSNLLMNTPMDDQQNDYAESIQQSAQNLLKIINDLLDVSKIRSGKFQFEHTPFLLRDAIKKAIYPLQLKAAEKEVGLEIDVHTYTPDALMGDPLRLQQIIINLVNNAIKFTERGAVKVIASSTPIDHKTVNLTIAVQDSGIGIAKDKVASVFDSYTQTGSDTARKYGGTGLGLTIVKQLVEMQQGNVQVSSVEGFGTTFTFNIPYQVALQADIENKQQQASQVVKKDLLKGVHILLAEDNAISQKVMRHTVQQQGATIDIAGNGLEAITMLDRGGYDVMLMDMQMPEMNGYEATRHVRRELQNNIPIIAMTASTQKHEIDRCLQAGCNAFISKPFDPAELYVRIMELVTTKKTTTMNGQDTAAQPASNEPLIDLAYLRELADNDPTYIKDVLDIFLETAPEGIEKLAALALDTTDWEATYKQAHFLKSSMSIVKVRGAYDMLVQIEKLARDVKEIDTIRSTTRNLLTVFAEAKPLLKKAYDENLKLLPKSEA